MDLMNVVSSLLLASTSTTTTTTTTTSDGTVVTVTAPPNTSTTAIDYVTLQITDFRTSNPEPIGIVTTTSGSPVEYKEITSTLNTNLIENAYLLDILTHFSRERIPERPVHARGAGAHGYLEVTHNVTAYTKAKFLNAIGKRTPVFGRFGPATQVDKGGTEMVRDARGFAIKFYTEDGNLDLAGFNTPMFFTDEPLEFFNGVHAVKKNPVTNLVHFSSFFDFAAERPAFYNFLIFVASDRGIPDGFRHMDGYPIHTYDLENENGDIHYVRFSFLTDQGIKNLNNSAAAVIQATDPDYMTRDLYNNIVQGSFPSWTLYIQVMTDEDVANADFDPFSMVKFWPTDKYPLRQVGKLVLDRNPTNYFAEVEQVAFMPGNLVPGILGSRDRMFQARRFSYLDAQNYRLGINHKQLPINRPNITILNYNRDGFATVDSQGGAPNYYPNSFDGPVPYIDNTRLTKSLIGKLVAHEKEDTDYFSQPRDQYNAMDEDEKNRLAQTIVTLGITAAPDILLKNFVYVTEISIDLAARVASALISALASTLVTTVL